MGTSTDSFGWLHEYDSDPCGNRRLLFLDHFHTLDRTTISSIEQRLGGPNRDTFILGMHQRNESLNGLSAMIASNGLDFCRNLWTTAGVAALTGLPDR